MLVYFYHNFLNPFAGLGTSVIHKLCFHKVSIFLMSNNSPVGKLLVTGKRHADFLGKCGLAH